MSRTLRIEYPGAVYHVQSEGNRGDAIYLDDEDRETFLRTFQEAARRSGWTVYAYALMANHYHILFQTARANLVDGMKWLQTAYTQRFNARHRMRGHLFAGRYHSMVVEADNAHYFSTIIDYIHLNPAWRDATRSFPAANGRACPHGWPLPPKGPNGFIRNAASSASAATTRKTAAKNTSTI